MKPLSQDSESFKYGDIKSSITLLKKLSMVLWLYNCGNHGLGCGRHILLVFFQYLS